MIKDDCIFCKIAAGEIPSDKVYEDDKVIAFKDLSPMMPVHVLIVPKDHYQGLCDEIPNDLLGHAMNKVKTVAELCGIAESGYRVVINTGDDAGQVVHHLHVHVLGGEPMNSGSPKKGAN